MPHDCTTEYRLNDQKFNNWANFILSKCSNAQNHPQLALQLHKSLIKSSEIDNFCTEKHLKTLEIRFSAQKKPSLLIECDFVTSESLEVSKTCQKEDQNQNNDLNMFEFRYFKHLVSFLTF